MTLAQIMSRNDTSIMKISSFLGLNENPDGDTTLKSGEMAEMRNFKITHDKHLQIRAGSKTILSLQEALEALGEEDSGNENEARFYGAWRGNVGNSERTLAAYGGHIWDIDINNATATDKGSLTEAETTFFGFGEKVYAMNGHEYLSWDGGAETTFVSVEGYVPVVVTACSPDGEGTLLENVNRLTGKRKVEFCPDGSAKTFKLPDKDIAEVVAVELNGEETTAFTSDLAAGSVTMNSAPASGVNTLTVVYRMGESAREEVTKMRFFELFNGSMDTRVFLYGDGTNKAIYSGVEYESGEPSAEYFPDLYEVEVGESNTPITALVRHYSRMMAYKPNSAWVIQYGTVALETNAVTAAFYVQPVNRQFGNEAYGQVKLLENNPLTLDVGNVYQWKSTSTSGYVGSGENNAKRISDRVTSTLSTFDLKNVKTFNIKSEHEYWFMYNKQALILNYANNSWYLYTDLTFDSLLEVELEKYGFSNNGDVVHFSRSYRSDNGNEIDCYAATGAMDFDKGWLLKYSPMIFVAIQPESGARLTVTTETNKRSDYPEKVVSYGLSTFSHVNFNHFSFGTNRKPQVKRVKMKVKKATFYRLIFKSFSASATATVIETDVQLRYAGSVK